MWYCYYTMLVTSSEGDYRFNINVTKEDYEYLNTSFNNDKKYIESYKEYRDSSVFGIGYYDGYTNSDSSLSKKIIDEYRKSDYGYNSYFDYDKELFIVTLYSYDNYKVRSIRTTVSSELASELVGFYNDNAKEYLANNEEWGYSYYVNDKYYGSYEEIGKFIANNSSDVVDTSKEYSMIRIYGLNSMYIFTTNKVEELNSVLEGYKSNLGDTDEVYYD